MVTDPLLVNLAFGPNLEYTSWMQMKINGMKFQTNDNSRGRTTDNTGVYLKGDAGQDECDWYGILNEILELQYLGEPKNRAVLFSGRSNWRVVVKCKPRGRIEAQEVLVQEEAYQNTEKISVRLINETEIPQTLTSLDGEVDIVNTQPRHTESDDEGAVDKGSSDDNESASAESIST
ncbi:hypothetical protein PIB30_050863 [Stylosanthes scabra]|uniref:Uncharacterized protein n=1 Tax=Stylosanthes scabra TaxID=79078 RepID=A0ABU6QI01_9FABA|nr:hypothetical protein [Stylosanthes scabra]